MSRARLMFHTGDRVRPAPGYVGLPLPSGLVRLVVTWGEHGVVYVDGSPLPWVAEAFELAPPEATA